MNIIMNVKEFKGLNFPRRANITFEAQEGSSILKIIISDNDNVYEGKVEAEVIVGGKVNLNQKVLEVLESISSDKASLVLKDGNLEVASEVMQVKVPVVTTEHQVLNAPFEGETFKIEAVKNYFKSILPCILDTSTRLPAGALIEIFNDNSMRLVATDAYRIVVIGNDNGKDEVKKSVILPKSILAVGEQMESLLCDEKAIVLSTDKEKFTTRTINVAFPEYRRIIPGEDSIKARFEVKIADIKNALKTVKLFNKRVVSFHLINNTIVLSAKDAENGGEIKQEIAINKLAGDDNYNPLSFNPIYLADGFNIIGNEKIEVIISDFMGGCVVLKNENALYMALRVANQES